MKTTKKVEEAPRRGRPSKQKSVYNEKKITKENLKSIVKEINDYKEDVIINEIQDLLPVKISSTEEVIVDQFEETVSTNPLDMDIKVIDFPENKYVAEKTVKTQIVLHHTSRGNLEEYLKSNDKKTTHYVIEKSGEITQLIDSDFWCNHLDIKKSNLTKKGIDENKKDELNKSSISIDLDSWGDLDKVGTTKYKTNNGTFIYLNDEKIVSYKNGFNKNKLFYEIGFKGKYYYEKYTTEQIESLGKLLFYLGKKHNIPLTYKGDEIFNVNINALNGESGVWTHVSYKDDVKNCHPDTELINKLKTL